MNATQIPVVACIRELTQLQVETEAAKLFPLNREELRELRDSSYEGFVRQYGSLLASYLRGNITRRMVNREFAEYVEGRAYSERQFPEWKKAMGASFDIHRQKWLTQAAPAE